LDEAATQAMGVLVGREDLVDGHSHLLLELLGEIRTHVPDGRVHGMVTGSGVLWIARNHALDPSRDAEFADFTHEIMEQDRRIVESQRPEEIPLDLREELHLKVPDASGIAYRRLLGEIQGIAAFMP
ncbi:MAG: hypothetical protein Q8Q52_00075, partial [Acidimicrobiia bacterium]|nr:hypothetical protein [Acidimicrobiia bacterium]